MRTFKTSAILELKDQTAQGIKRAKSRFDDLKKSVDGFNRAAKNPGAVRSLKEFNFRSRQAKDRLRDLRRDLRSGKGDFEKISREIDQTSASLRRLNKANRGFRARSIAGSIGRGGLRTGAAIGVAGAGLGALAIRQTVNFGKEADEIGKFAKRVGFATESISALRAVVAETAGDEGVAALAPGLTAFNRRLGELKKGRGELVSLNDEFKTLLLSANSTEDAFVKFIEKAREIEDISELSAVLDKGLSEAGRKLVNFARTSDGEIKRIIREARALGGIVSDEDARKAAEFNDELGKLRLGFKGIGFSIGRQLIDPFREFIERTAIPKVIEFRKSIEGIDANTIEGAFERVAGLVERVATGLTGAFKVIEGISAFVDRREKKQLAKLNRDNGRVGIPEFDNIDDARDFRSAVRNSDGFIRRGGFQNRGNVRRVVGELNRERGREILDDYGPSKNWGPEIVAELQRINKNTSNQRDGVAPDTKVGRATTNYSLTRNLPVGGDALLVTP